jgi:hypothetical protein
VPPISAWSSSPGELQGSHDRPAWSSPCWPRRRGWEREYIRDRTLEGHESARARGKSSGDAVVTDEAMLAAALHLRGQEMSLRDIADRLVARLGPGRVDRGTSVSPVSQARTARTFRARRTDPAEASL